MQNADATYLAVVVAIDAYLSTQLGLRIGNAGIPALGTSGDWAESGSGYGSLDTLKAMAPALTLVEIGADDAGSSVPTATYLANLAAVVAAAKISGDVLLWTCPQPPASGGLNQGYVLGYNAAQLGAYASLGCGLVDIAARLGPFATGWGAQGLCLGDDVHPSELGNADIAAALNSALASVA